MDSVIILSLSSIAALVTTIIMFITIIPKKKKAGLGDFGKFLHDLFNFKSLWIEKILQFCYVLSTTYVVFLGILGLFYVEETYHFSYYGSGYYTSEWRGYYGIIILVAGPIAVRIAYEIIMMFIIAIKNIIQINNKLKDQNEEKAPENTVNYNAPIGYVRTTTPTQHSQPTQPINQPAVNQYNQPRPMTPKFCTRCGSALGADGNCTNPACPK